MPSSPSRRGPATGTARTCTGSTSPRTGTPYSFPSRSPRAKSTTALLSQRCTTSVSMAIWPLKERWKATSSQQTVEASATWSGCWPNWISRIA